jgi:single-stranded-DNA-specific exonuclease
MDAAKDSFIEYGGHKGAGGFSITLEEVGTLEEALSAALAQLSSQAAVEAEGISISLQDIGEELWKTVARFSPFGMGNEKPVFTIANAPITSVRQFGKEQNHLEIMLGGGVKAISFFASPESYRLAPTASSCTLHAHLEKSYFRNRPELRLRIVDIEA